MKGPCESCGSSDGNHTYPDGHTWCFVCETGVWPDGHTSDSSDTPTKTVNEMTGFIEKIADRGLSKATCQKYGITQEVGPDGHIIKHYYPYINTKTGELTATKKRICATKDFPWSGDRADIGLFGQQTCKGRGKYITVTEGELDAAALSQMFDNRWDVVSLRDGAQSALKGLRGQLDFLEGYENIVLCFDADQYGREAVAAVQDLFSPGKLKIVTMPQGMKDAGECLTGGKQKEFISAWWDAKTYRPDGIVAGEDTWNAIIESTKVMSVPYPWQGLNELTLGIRCPELVTVTSGSGMGKSQIIREIEHHLLGATEENIGVLALEENIARTSMGIMSVAANRPLHLEKDTPLDDLRPFWESTLGTGRYFLFDHFGSTGIDNLLARCRYMAKALGCKYVILDHLSIVVSAQDNGDERKAIDAVMTQLRTLVQELSIGMFLVSHLRRTSGTSHEDGGRVSLSDLRGSQAIAQLSDCVIGLERNQQADDPVERNTTLVRVLKNRYTGETGPACYLHYEKDTGRMREVPGPADSSAEPEEF